MADVGKISRNTPKPFPVIRKSNDPLKPETGEVEFSQYLAETDEVNRKEVQGTAETEGSIIRDDERRKRLRLKEEKREGEEKEEDEKERDEDEEEEEGKIIDVEV